MGARQATDDVAAGLVCPFSLRVDTIACMLNFELSEHPVYEGGELQWFDDDEHGTGMLAFLSRRDGRRVDYYAGRGLRIDRDGYQIGGGTGSWTETDFDAARLEVTHDGVDAEVRFTDIDGRPVEIRINDRDGRPRRPGGLLAPVSAGIKRPVSLLLVWMPRFDLVRATGTSPVIRIDGVDACTGRLPGMRLHGRHLIKYAAPVVTAELNRGNDGPIPMLSTGQAGLDDAGAIRSIRAERAGHQALLALSPAFPALPEMPDASSAAGRWHLEVDGVRLTGGAWAVARTAATVEVVCDVDEQWKPASLPWLMRLMTTVMPVFRRWPTTYRWRARLRLGARPSTISRWQRTGAEDGQSYRRATGS